MTLGLSTQCVGGDLTASVLHGLGDGVGNSMGNGQRSSNRGDSNSRGSSVGGMVAVGEVLSISIGVSLSFGISLPLAVVGNGVSNGGVTEGVNDLSAHLLVLDLLGGEDHVLGDTGGSRGSVVGDRSHRSGNS